MLSSVEHEKSFITSGALVLNGQLGYTIYDVQNCLVADGSSMEHMCFYSVKNQIHFGVEEEKHLCL